MFIGAELSPATARQMAVEQAWAQLASPGPTLTSRERLEVVAGARRAWEGAEAPDHRAGVNGLATYWLAVDAEGITADLVSDFVSRGLPLESYLEIVGIVARLSNVDWYLRGIGAPLPLIPQPEDSPPTGNIAADARITDSWVPMLGDAMAPHTLDALPDEAGAMRALLYAMYVPNPTVNWSIQEDLSRIQTEYIAARTSYLNECFY